MGGPQGSDPPVSRQGMGAATYAEVHSAETKRIASRRVSAELPLGNPAKDSVGLALSGGGIRSATFNLGVLQALQACGVFPHVDYLSTVSGGGYIGSSLTWFMSCLKRDFPFGTSRSDNPYDVPPPGPTLGQRAKSFAVHLLPRGGGQGPTDAGSGGGAAASAGATPPASPPFVRPGAVVAWLRAHDRYLTPGDGLTLWALIAMFLAGLLVNLLVLIPLALLALWVCTRQFLWTAPLCLHLHTGKAYSGDVLAWMLSLGAAFLALYLVMALVLVACNRFRAARKFLFQRAYAECMGYLLLFSFVWAVLGSVPIVHQWVGAWFKTITSSLTLSGLVATVGSLAGTKGKKALGGLRTLILTLGLSLLVYGIYLGLYHVVHRDGPPPWWLIPSVGLALALAFLVNVNQLSMHRYYRNRLMEAYFPYDLMGVPVTRADQCLLSSIGETAAPYQIINTNIQTVGSEDARLRERGGDSFILSPLYCGAECTGYAPTGSFAGGTMDLATALAISGAAADPNTSATRSRPLSLLMTLLNVRLGCWVENPGQPAYFRKGLLQPWLYYYLVRELFGRGLDETKSHVHLSDGGHFENLGLYELVHRRCRCIIVSDAAADPEYAFGDFARAIERVRVDFSAKIDLGDVTPLRSEKVTGKPAAGFKTGSVTYDDGSKAVLIYLKPVIISDLPQDVLTYDQTHDPFPNQSTLDQFFDEQQFEAYRELGFQIARAAWKGGAFIAVDSTLAGPAPAGMTVASSGLAAPGASGGSSGAPAAP